MANKYTGNRQSMWSEYPVKLFKLSNAKWEKWNKFQKIKNSYWNMKHHISDIYS